MKQILLCVLSMSLWACKGDHNSSAQDAGQPAPAQAGAAAGSPVAGAPNRAESGSFLPPQAPGDNPLAEILMRDFWIFEFYVVDDPALRAANKGRWFKFYPDGTFEAGLWQEKTGYGSWSLQTVDGDRILRLDNIVDAEDIQWEIQGVNSEQDTMTWAGINKTNNAGAITKVINLLTRPTKAQFGVEG